MKLNEPPSPSPDIPPKKGDFTEVMIIEARLPLRGEVYRRGIEVMKALDEAGIQGDLLTLAAFLLIVGSIYPEVGEAAMFESAAKIGHA